MYLRNSLAKKKKKKGEPDPLLGNLGATQIGLVLHSEVRNVVIAGVSQSLVFS